MGRVENTGEGNGAKRGMEVGVESAGERIWQKMKGASEGGKRSERHE